MAEDRIGGGPGYKPGGGSVPYRQAAEQRVRGRYTKGAGGQRTYHAPMPRALAGGRSNTQVNETFDQGRGYRGSS